MTRLHLAGMTASACMSYKCSRNALASKALSASMAALVVAGAVRAEMLPLFAIVLPALMLPSLLGARVYKGLSPLGFRRVVLALLSCVGVAMIAASLPRGPA